MQEHVKIRSFLRSRLPRGVLLQFVYCTKITLQRLLQAFVGQSRLRIARWAAFALCFLWGYHQGSISVPPYMKFYHLRFISACFCCFSTPCKIIPYCCVITFCNYLALCRKHKRRDEVTEQHVSLLLNCGLLTRHLTQKDAYWFALAGIGPLIKSLIKGRKVS